ncbi:YdbL family protein [Plasticicumulans acidivorans]|uniref:DUF1318 domain-containing protein n=1 Tax=Plasticicumulans acidivorans TaxID=886464 RepID=A0A317MWY3_9GAMM|nr:YdbL family protein [Plasticicumulans acidivorans]PWV62484.1 hypothetical protein C7443_104280 [Plasticicumulans acidivorans]
MNRHLQLLRALLLVVVTAGMAQPVLAADPLATARAAGQVGERADGLLGLPAQASSSLREQVDMINAERLQKYREIAGRTGRPLREVQSLAGSRLIEATPNGQWVMDTNGQWRRR